MVDIIKEGVMLLDTDDVVMSLVVILTEVDFPMNMHSSATPFLKST